MPDALSAVAAALAGGVLAGLLSGLGVSRWVALAGGILLGMIPSVWRLAVVAEVYSLHLLLMVSVIALALRARRTGSVAWALLAFYVWCLAMGNHLTTLHILPALLVLILPIWWSSGARMRLFGLAALCAAFAATQYLYFFVRSRDPAAPYLEIPVHDWGDLWRLVSGASYRNAMFPFSLEQLVTEVAPAFGRQLWRECHWLLALAAVGLVRLRDRRIDAAMVLYFAIASLWVMNYNVHDIFDHFLPVYAVVVLLAAVGLDAGIRRFGRRGRRWAAPLVLVIPLAFLLGGWSRADRSRDTYPQDYIERVLQQIEGEGVVLSPSYDPTMWLLYFIVGENLPAAEHSATSERPPTRENLHVQGHSPAGDIYVLQEYDTAQIAAYVKGRRTTLTSARKRTVPSGVAVYGLTADQAEDVRAHGLAVEWLDRGLFRVVAR